MTFIAVKLNDFTCGDCDRHYVGRPSPLGNPFVIGRDGTRAEVIAKYKARLIEKMKSQDAAVCNALRELLKAEESGKTVALMCHCKPLACHADVIIEALESIKARRLRRRPSVH